MPFSSARGFYSDDELSQHTEPTEPYSEGEVDGSVWSIHNGLGAGGSEAFLPTESDEEAAGLAREPVAKAVLQPGGGKKRRAVKADSESEQDVPFKHHRVARNCMIDGIGVQGNASSDESDQDEDPNTEDEAFIADEDDEADEDFALEQSLRVCDEYKCRRMTTVINGRDAASCISAYKSLAAGDPDTIKPHQAICLRDLPRVLEAMRYVIMSRFSSVKAKDFLFKAKSSEPLLNRSYGANDPYALPPRSSSAPVIASKSSSVKRVVVKSADKPVQAVDVEDAELSEDENNTAFAATTELKLSVSAGGRTRFPFATAANLHPLCIEEFGTLLPRTLANCKRLCKAWMDRLITHLAPFGIKDAVGCVEICPTKDRFHGHLFFVKPTADPAALPDQIRIGVQLREALKSAAAGVPNHIKFANALGAKVVIGYIKKGDEPKPADGWAALALAAHDDTSNWSAFGLFVEPENIALHFRGGGVNRGARKEVIALALASGDLASVARTATSDQLAALVGCARGLRDVISLRQQPRSYSDNSVFVQAFLGLPGSGKTRAAVTAAEAKVAELRSMGISCDDPVWYSFQGAGGFMGGENVGANSLVCIFDEIPPSMTDFQNVMKAWNKDGGPCQLSHCGSRPNFFGKHIYLTSKNHPKMWCVSIRGRDEDPSQVYRRLARVTFCEQTPVGYRTETRSRTSSEPWYDVTDWDRFFPDVTVTPPTWRQ